MRIYFCGITFSMLYNFGAAILRAAGDTRARCTTDPGRRAQRHPQRHIRGGLSHGRGRRRVATAISQALSAVLVLLALKRRDDACRLMLPK
jgi:Na+-driven multidrug efflux pump